MSTHFISPEHFYITFNPNKSTISVTPKLKKKSLDLMLLEALKPRALRFVVSFFRKHAKFSPSGIGVTLKGMLSFSSSSKLRPVCNIIIIMIIYIEERNQNTDVMF